MSIENSSRFIVVADESSTDTHNDKPVYIEIDGHRFGFSEVSLKLGSKLEQWIKKNLQNPLQVVRENLDGFAYEDRVTLLDQARRDAANWPPHYGSSEMIRILGASPAGQIETIYVGLMMNHPDATRADAEWVWRRIRHDEEKSRLIFGIIFGVEYTHGIQNS